MPAHSIVLILDIPAMRLLRMLFFQMLLKPLESFIRYNNDCFFFLLRTALIITHIVLNPEVVEHLRRSWPKKGINVLEYLLFFLCIRHDVIDQVDQVRFDAGVVCFDASLLDDSRNSMP